MDLNPIHYLSQAKKMNSSSLDYVQLLMTHPLPLSSQKMKCSYFDYIQLLMIGQAGRWTQTPSATPIQQEKNELLIFGIRSTSDDRLGWSMDSNPICHLSPARKLNASFWIMFNFSWSGGSSMDSKPYPLPLSSQKYELFIFGLCSASDDQLAS